MLSTDNLKEAERLKELYLYDILDTEAEKEFDDLAELAAQLCECPIAFINFIDKDRVWSKSRKGTELVELERAFSFCTPILISDGPVVVEDAQKDPLFAQNPVVTGKAHIQFYAGVPVYSSNRHKLGTVCVFDHHARSVTNAQLAALKIISKQVSSLLDLRLRNKMLQEYSRKLLLSSEQSFEAFFNQSKNVKWIYDLETLRILQVNEMAVKKYGYSREEFLQLTVNDIRSDDAKKEIHQLFQRSKVEGKPATFITTHHTKEGRVLQVEVTVSDLVYMGKPARMALLVDITENEQLKKELEEEKQVADQRLTEAALTAREDERDFIGKELHDNINQILTSTKLYLDMASSHKDLMPEMVSRSRGNIEQAIGEIRRLSHGLVASGGGYNLTTAIQELAQSYLASGSFVVQTSINGNMEGLPEDLKLAVFRIIQEQFSNISKHAGASEVSLSLLAGPGFTLELRDNGKGFEPGKAKRGIGISNIKSRAGFYNGAAIISSAPGKGTTLQVKIPLE